MARGRTGPYLVQAAIADLYLYQPRDWRQIAALYQTLAQQTRSPIVEMNRAIAGAEIDGPEAGLAILDRRPERARLRQHMMGARPDRSTTRSYTRSPNRSPTRRRSCSFTSTDATASAASSTHTNPLPELPR
jgi:predicted RNA polymerase sigma factor